MEKQQEGKDKTAKRGATAAKSQVPSNDFLKEKGVKFFIKLLLVSSVLFIGNEAVDRIVRGVDRPVNSVQVITELKYQDQQELQQLLMSAIDASFFDVDLVYVQKTVETLPWIRSANVIRKWPDKVVVDVEEQLPVARWSGKYLLSREGELFSPEFSEKFDVLPLLVGPEQSEDTVMNHYVKLGKILRSVNLDIATLTLNERGSWSLLLSNSVELVIGKVDVLERTRRFTKVYEIRLISKIEEIEKIDMRYSNGIAIKWV